MGWDMAVASIGMDLKAMQFQQNYATAIQDMAMDNMELAAEELVDMVSASNPVQIPKGEFVDIYV